VSEATTPATPPEGNQAIAETTASIRRAISIEAPIYQGSRANIAPMSRL
jgi:hypothetical protein